MGKNTNILESLVSSGVIETDTLKQLEESFENRVLVETETRMQTEKRKLDKKFKQKENFIIEKAEEYTSIVENAAEEYTSIVENAAEEYASIVENAAEEYVKIQKAEILETLDNYLDIVVEQWIKENNDNIQKMVNVKQLDALQEGFKALLVTGAITLDDVENASKLDENNKDNIIESKNREINKLANEVSKLRKENEKIQKSNIIKDVSEGMTLMQAEKLSSLSESFDFVDEDVFSNRVKDLKSSLLEAESKAKRQSESKQTGRVSISSFSHLI